MSDTARLLRTSIDALNRAASNRSIAYQCDCFVTSEVAHNEVISRIGRRVPGSAPEQAYVGVGPCQNFTYLAYYKPSVAIIVDGRIDNFLEHLLFKAAFEISTSPLTFLCHLLGRSVPDWVQEPNGSARELLRTLDLCPATDRARSSFERFLVTRLGEMGLSPQMTSRTCELLRVFHRRQLTVTSVGEEMLLRLDRIPNLKDVVSASSSQGFNLHYLTSPDRFKAVREMHLENRVVPLLGSITEEETLRGLKDILSVLSLDVSMIYLSNLEEFLIERYVIDDDGSISRPNSAGRIDGVYATRYDSLVAFISGLPRTPDCLLIRFFFPGVHRSREVGIFPWLEGHVTFASSYLQRVTAPEATSVFDTYL